MIFLANENTNGQRKTTRTVNKQIVYEEEIDFNIDLRVFA